MPRIDFSSARVLPHLQVRAFRKIAQKSVRRGKRSAKQLALKYTLVLQQAPEHALIMDSTAYSHQALAAAQLRVCRAHSRADAATRAAVRAALARVPGIIAADEKQQDDDDELALELEALSLGDGEAVDELPLLEPSSTSMDTP
jgi:hypothetical protein